MVKLNIKSDKIFSYGGIFHTANKFDQTIDKTTTETLGECQSANAVNQYNEVFCALACNYMCGGDCL